ncbi:high-affinity iron permease FTR1 [Ascoidea rubescens DSM 1968]|uniref:Putative high-affinity iron permease n=1 Tax=Ascoidea rubescens DSM 1968 TaxID=1344418 RepID=A0A1D2V921_9ASCO|nr:putative high-affinity iron permease [Ascoidea rubescens DSM 1968]ODV58128.1 putative high-affinity iron permease [Ascoidea rubescens DSM 1968]
MANNVFAVEVFFIVFREALEAVIVISVLLAFLKQGLGKATDDPKVYKKLVRQVWFGAVLGVFICLVLGGAFIGAFYSLDKDIWSNSEDLWEGIFCLIATVVISIMGIPMLRINKMQEKWRLKLAQALVAKPKSKKTFFNINYNLKKYAMFILPFITTLREGLEAVVFVGGVGLDYPAKAFPLPVIIGLIAGIAVGVVLYYSGKTSSLQIFLVISTAILYLIAAGLFSRGVWFLEANVFNRKTGGDAAESGSGPGSYDITKVVWHVNCCNPLIDNGWDIFNALFGWQNTATYGSVISYNVYWLVLICILLLMLFEEKKGHLPFCKNLTLAKLNPMYYIKGKKQNLSEAEKEEIFQKANLQVKQMEVESLENSSKPVQLK